MSAFERHSDAPWLNKAPRLLNTPGNAYKLISAPLEGYQYIVATPMNPDGFAARFLFPAEAQKMLQGVLKAPNGASSGAQATDDRWRAASGAT